MTSNDDRVQRYAEAIREAMSLYGEYDEGDQVERVMAVADAERAEQRAEVERLRGDLGTLRHDLAYAERRAAGIEDRAETVEAKLDRVEAVLYEHPDCISECACATDAVRAVLDGDA